MWPVSQYLSIIECLQLLNSAFSLTSVSAMMRGPPHAMWYPFPASCSTRSSCSSSCGGSSRSSGGVILSIAVLYVSIHCCCGCCMRPHDDYDIGYRRRCRDVVLSWSNQGKLLLLSSVFPTSSSCFYPAERLLTVSANLLSPSLAAYHSTQLQSLPPSSTNC